MIRTAAIPLLLVFLLAANTTGQRSEDIGAPADNLARSEHEKWLVQALGKYGEYKSPAMNVSVSRAKFVGCTLNFDLIRKSNPRPNDTVNAVYKTKGVKHPVSIDLSRVARVSAEEYLDPELEAIVLRTTDGPSNSGVEIIVQRVASDAIRTAFERMRLLCAADR